MPFSYKFFIFLTIKNNLNHNIMMNIYRFLQLKFKKVRKEIKMCLLRLEICTQQILYKCEKENCPIWKASVRILFRDCARRDGRNHT